MDQDTSQYSFRDKVTLFRNFDEARQTELEEMAERYERMSEELNTLKADLKDEQTFRRTWRRRAEAAEHSIVRNQFVLVLVDGDGYYFSESFLKDAGGSGGAKAARQLDNDIKAHLRMSDLIDGGSDLQVMVNVYANRAGLAKTLCDAGMLQTAGQFDQFFCSFTQSQSLFQFVDCGHGKERADAKLRDTYRFYAYNAHCKYIFLACCHDNGYVAELDRYHHDPVAAPKTILIQSAQTARQYSALNFPIIRLNEVFESTPLQFNRKEPVAAVGTPQSTPAAPARSSPEVPSNHAQPATWSVMAGGSSQNTSTKVQLRPAPSSMNTDNAQQTTRGIPINRVGQRLDRKLRQPTTQELNDFEQRIRYQKLCNRHHLHGDCPNYNCKYDHDPIDDSLKNTLKQKARSIPCTNGQYCRLADCYYGHQCPWGMETCSNPKCAYLKTDMHNVVDTEVAKVVPAEEG